MHDDRLIRLARQNLNLLVLFDALMTYRHLSRAAEVLCLSQPAMSHGLRRLREHFNDELFIKRGGGMQPTPFAQNIADAVQQALAQLDRTLFEPAAFDYASSRRCFHLGVNDYSSQLLLPGLMARLQRLAPTLRLQIVHCPIADQDDINDRLSDSELDLAVAVLDRAPALEQSCLLCEDPLVVVMDRSHPLWEAPMTVEQFVSYPHAAVSMREQEPVLINALLASQGLRRQVMLTTPYVATLPEILRDSELLAVVPKKAAELMVAKHWVGYRPLPFRVRPFSVCLVWPRSRSADPGVSWLVEQIRALESFSAEVV